MDDVRKERSTDYKELATFLSDINNQKQSHIGFCGEEQGEIHKTLKEDFIIDNEVTFFEARNKDDEIVFSRHLKHYMILFFRIHTMMPKQFGKGLTMMEMF